MKQINRFSILLLAGLVFVFSCAKEQADSRKESASGKESEEALVPAGKTVTISALLADAMTKVDFDPTFDAGNDKKLESLSLCWESTDKLLVADHAHPENSALFDLTDGEGTKKAVFSGTAPAGATSYDVSIVHGDVTYGSQTQADDGDASHLQLIASKKNISDLSTITFDELNSVLAITALMPEGVAGGIRYVDITAMEADGQTPANIFGTGNSLTIRLDDNTGDDDYLHLFAALPAGDTEIPAGTTLLMHFGAPETAHEVYTRFVTLGSGLTFTAGKLNTINVNASHSDKHAGLPTCDGTSADKAYLIGDKYQMDSMNVLAPVEATTCFKMIDDVNMKGMAAIDFNRNVSEYSKKVDFNGNNKTISKLNKDMFYVFKGSIYDLTLDSCVVSSRGILAEYIQGTGNTITNVNITNGSVSCTSEKTGGLVGIVNNGTSNVTAVTISGCHIMNTNVTVSNSKGNAGGLIGFVDAKVEVDNCTVSKTGTGTYTVKGASSNTGGLIGNMGSENNITAINSSISNCSVSGINVTGVGVVGGVVGFANTKATISGCSYTGGVVTNSGRFTGGFVGSTGNYESTITNCQVESATVDASSYKGDARLGGFVGQINTNVRVKGCTVGSTDTKVLVKTGSPDLGKDNAVGGSGENVDTPINSGGFVGVNYGTITKNGDVRTKAYVQVTSANTYGTPLNLGGFVGFGRGTIEFSDAIIDMSTLQGQYIGGFCGRITSSGTAIDHCTVTGGTVKGNNYTGGFAGYVDSDVMVTNNEVCYGTTVNGQSSVGGFAGLIKAGTVTGNTVTATVQLRGGNGGGFVGGLEGGTVQNCSASGSIQRTEGSNNVFGGFAGYVKGTGLVKCSSTMTLNMTSVQYIGGLIGSLQTANEISKCYYSGTITGASNGGRGGLVGIVETVAATITDCYTSGSCTGSSVTQIYGGIVGELKAGASVTNCYSTMSFKDCGRATGGIVGRACSAGWPVSNESGNTISNCIAWNDEITFAGTAGTSASSGAIVGYTSFKNNLSNCYRRPDMVYKNSNSAVGTTCQTSMIDQPDCDGTSWGINGNRPSGSTPGTSADAQYQAPYYGKIAANAWTGVGADVAPATITVSVLAQKLGWSSDIWDFTGDLPTLK